MQYEQLSFELFGKPKEKNIRDVRCKFEAPLRRYFCEDNWYAIECRGCPNYQKENIYDDIENDCEDVEYLDYSSFKNWLYYNFPKFIDKEIENGVWEYKDGKKKASVEIRPYSDTFPHQYISVSYDLKNSGASIPCDKLEEVKMYIKKAFEKLERGEQ